jgi:hypothetical protein
MLAKRPAPKCPRFGKADLLLNFYPVADGAWVSFAPFGGLVPRDRYPFQATFLVKFGAGCLSRLLGTGI